MRIIDADALKEKSYWECYSDPDDDYEYVLVTDIDREPTIDAVHVVRCKDCKHRDPEDKKCDCGHGIIWQLPRDDNWFCADGERRTDDCN